MDEAHLKKIMGEEQIPAADDKAKKQALNLAMAEFDAVQQKKQKSFQGISILTRLMGNSNAKSRRSPMQMNMNRRFVYGGMATAMVIVLAAGATLNYSSLHTGKSGGDAMKVPAPLSTVAFNVTGGTPTVKRQNETQTLAQLDSNNISITGRAEKSSASPPQPEPLAKAAAEKARAKTEYRLADREALPEADIAGDGSITNAQPSSPPHTATMEMKVARMDAPVGGIAQSIAPIVSADDMTPQYYKDVGRDKFKDFEENPVKVVTEEPVSTFSIDVDTSSYSFIRRQINAGTLPQKDAVRIEEMVNYFDYDYAVPDNKEQPFKPTVTVVPSPWKDGNKLIHIGIKGYDVQERPRANLVFLLDTSGSMHSPDKLPLLKNSMKLLLDTLSPDDTVAIVAYAGAAGTVLEPTKAENKNKILTALDNLNAGGSTAGAEGIRQAYQLAESEFNKEAVNRVILATDGDFNVGITNPEELKDFIERKRETGIFLSVLGFGQGNYNDNLMQELAQNGNGVAAYIDTLNEARKVLVTEASSTLFPIAKDVKIQVEFNPATVAEYRLVGYETRHLNREDFNNDKVDAGDIGAGHAVTAIYEITPVGGPRTVDESRYADNKTAMENTEQTQADTDFSDEYAFLKIRYKLPNEDTSKLITTPITSADVRGWVCPPCPIGVVCESCLITATDDVKFSVAVATFGQLLKGSKYNGAMTYDDVIDLAQESKGKDGFGYRAEFINLVRLTKSAAALEDTQP